MASKQHNAKILAEALELGLIRALDFVELAQRVDADTTSIEDLLQERGFATLEQCQWLADRALQSVDHDVTHAPTSCAEPVAEAHDGANRLSGDPASAANGGHADATVAPGNSASGSNPRSGGASPSSQPSQPSGSRRLTFPLAPARPLLPNDHDSGSARYRWREKFAEGGLGAVWRADDVRLQRAVAVKEVLPKVAGSPETVERFLNEARITAQLDHPGVVPVYDLGYKPDGSPFYAMKFLEGQTLSDVIGQYHQSEGSASQHTLLLHQLLRTFVDVCNTVAFAHSRQVIHRDLKPRNIMVGQFGETIVLDWGLAKKVGSSNDTVDLRSGSQSDPQAKHTACDNGVHSTGSHTQMGQMLGTPTYASPEQARGEQDRLDARSDIYSLGVILYEILVGRAPWSGRDTQEVLELVRSGAMIEPRATHRHVPAPLNAICVKALQADPSARFDSATDLADEINRYLAGEAVRVHREAASEKLMRWFAHHRSVALVAAFTVLVSLVFLIAITTISIVAWRREQTLRQQTERSRQLAIAAHHAEGLAKQEALRNMHTALDSIDQWLLGLSADLEYYPGLSHVRSSWLEKAATHYRALATAPVNDAALTLCQHQAFIRLGDVLQLAGQHQEAADAYSLAATWFEQQRQTMPQNHELTKQLANARVGQGIALSAIPEKQEHAAKCFAQARQLLQATLASEPAQEHIPYALARLDYGEASLALRLNQWTVARDLLQRARRTLSVLVQQPSAPLRVRALHRAVLFDLARQSLDRQQLQDVGDPLAELFTSLERSVADEPHRPDHREAMMVARVLQGNAFFGQGRLLEAQQAYRQGVDEFQRLTEALFRGAYHSELLATATSNLALIELGNGQSTSALPLLEKAKNEYSALIRMHGYDQQPSLLRGYAHVSRLLGDVWLELGDLTQSRQQLEATDQVLSHLLASPDDSSRSADVAHEIETLRQLATVAYLDDQEVAADAHLERADQWIIGAADQGLDSGELFEAHTDCLIFRAHIRWLKGSTEAATDAYHQAHDLLMSESDPTRTRSLSARRSLVWLLTFCPDDMLRDVGAAERLAQQLVTDAPTHPDHWTLLAAVQCEKRRFAEAQRSLAESRRLRSGRETPTDLCVERLVFKRQGATEQAAQVEKSLNEQFPVLRRLPSLQVMLESE